MLNKYEIKYRHLHRRNFGTSVTPKLEGKSKMLHFSLCIKSVYPDPKATAPRYAATYRPIYESIRSFPVLFSRAGRLVFHFAPVVHLTPPIPTNYVELANMK